MSQVYEAARVRAAKIRPALCLLITASVPLLLAACGHSSPNSILVLETAPVTAPEPEPEAPEPESETPEPEPEPESETPEPEPEPEPEAPEPEAPEPEAPEPEPEAPVIPEIPEAAWGTVSDLIHTATGADAVRRDQLPIPITIGLADSHSTTITQTIDGPRYAGALPWHDDDWNLNFTFSMLTGLLSEDLAPVSMRGRAVETDTAIITEAERHGLGSDWRAFEIGKPYLGAGTLALNITTDANESHELERPWVGYGNFGRQIELSGIPALPPGEDWQGVIISGPLTGSLDGVPGVFTAPDSSKCLPVVGCYMELNRDAPASGYFPRGQVLFTPENPDTPEATLQDLWTVTPPPPVDVLIFGDWLYVPGDTASSHDYDLGLFGGGGDPYASSVHDLEGTVAYVGYASGRCFTRRSSENPRVGRFEADVILTATTDDEAALGGRVENLRFDAVCAGLLTELHLESAMINPHAAGMAAAAGVATEQSGSAWAGQWRAAFYGNGENPADPPTGVAGTFGISTDDLGLAGSFGAHRRNPAD